MTHSQIAEAQMLARREEEKHSNEERKGLSPAMTEDEAADWLAHDDGLGVPPAAVEKIKSQCRPPSG